MGKVYICNRYPTLKLSNPGSGEIEFQAGKYEAKNADEEQIIEKSGFFGTAINPQDSEAAKAPAPNGDVPGLKPGEKQLVPHGTEQKPEEKKDEKKDEKEAKDSGAAPAHAGLKGTGTDGDDEEDDEKVGAQQRVHHTIPDPKKKK